MRTSWPRWVVAIIGVGLVIGVVAGVAAVTDTSPHQTAGAPPPTTSSPPPRHSSPVPTQTGAQRPSHPHSPPTRGPEPKTRGAGAERGAVALEADRAGRRDRGRPGVADARDQCDRLADPRLGGLQRDPGCGRVGMS